MSTNLSERRDRLLAQHPTWQPRTISQLLAQTASAQPDRPYVITESRTYTYDDVEQWSRRLARGLISQGVEPGDHVAMIMANHPEFIALKFAISSIGAVAVPLNFLFRTEEMRYVIGQSDCVVLITMERFRDLDYLAMLDEIAPQWETAGGGVTFPNLHKIVTFDPQTHTRSDAWNLESLIAAGDDVSESRVDDRQRAGDPNGISDIVYTSGTTGFPKGAMLTHENVLRTAYSSALIRGIGDGHTTVFAMPLYHVFSYVEGLLAVMWVGGAVIPQLMFDPIDTFTSIEAHGADEVLLVPTMTIALVEHPRRREFDLHTLRTVMSASAPAPIRVWEMVGKELGVTDIVTAYGQTETSASTTYTMPGDPLELVSSTVGRAKPGGLSGDPGLGEDAELGPLVTLYKTVDPTTGADLPVGEEGELVLCGPEVMVGYYNQPEVTAAVFDEQGWLHSGDLGRIRSDGYIELTGRSKELYKCGSELVAPKEIEELLSARSDVAQAYVVGLSDDQMGEVGCAFIVPASGSQPNETEILSYCRSNLARFKVPKHVMFLDSDDLPQTPTGKVQKFKLVENAEKVLDIG